VGALLDVLAVELLPPPIVVAASTERRRRLVIVISCSGSSASSCGPLFLDLKLLRFAVSSTAASATFVAL
jgi:hypothetical protein